MKHRWVHPVRDGPSRKGQVGRQLHRLGRWCRYSAEVSRLSIGRPHDMNNDSLPVQVRSAGLDTVALVADELWPHTAIKYIVNVGQCS